MSMKPAAYVAFIMNTFLFGTYYAVAKNALGHIDPVMFSYFEMMTLVPAGLCILLCCWRRVTRAVVKRGMMLGSSLCLALFTISIALKYTSATSTAFFPSLNGFLAAMIALLVLRQPVTKATWVAGILSVVGTAMLILNSSMDGLRGVLIAFLGGVFFTIYVFLSDSTHESGESKEEEIAPLPLFGVELLTMAVWANLVVLLFGDWQTMHLVLPQDGLTILYVATACTFVPTLVAAFMQKHVSPVTVSFIYILEPVFGAIIAYLYLHETLPLPGYIGGALVVFGAVIHTWGMARIPQQEPVIRANTRNYARTGRAYTTYKAESMLPMHPNPIMMMSTFVYPIVLAGAAITLFAWLGGLPPIAWSILYSQVSHNNLQNYYGLWPMTVEQEMLLAQALCWLIAWIAFALTFFIAARHAYQTMKDRSAYQHRMAQQQVQRQKEYVIQRQRQQARVEASAVRERVTDDLIEEYDTLPVPRPRKLREYYQPERRTESVEWHHVGA